MTSPLPPPTPPSDLEVERRLAALKSGADPAAFEPPPPSAGGSPAREPRPALVGEVVDEGSRRPPGSREGSAGTPAGGPPTGPGVRVVSWGISQAEAGRLSLWIGVGLIGVGAYFVLSDVVPGFALVGAAGLAIAGVALVAWHVAGRAGSWALHVGAVVAGYGIAGLVAELAGLPSAGWGTLGMGAGLLAIAAARLSRGQRLGWQGWVGGAIAIFGGWGVLGATIPGFPSTGDAIVALVLVGVGIVILRRGVRGR